MLPDNDVMLALGRVEGKLDLLLDLEPRVRSLEKSRAYHSGLVAAIGAASASVATFISTHWGFKI